MDQLLDNASARAWYREKLREIPAQVDKKLSLEEQARQAFDLRNQYRTQTRDMMADTAARHKLDHESPHWEFEALVQDKMRRKGFTRNQALRDIIGTASKTNSGIDRSLGF